MKGEIGKRRGMERRDRGVGERDETVVKGGRGDGMGMGTVRRRNQDPLGLGPRPDPF